MLFHSGSSSCQNLLSLISEKKGNLFAVVSHAKTSNQFASWREIPYWCVVCLIRSLLFSVTWGVCSWQVPSKGQSQAGELVRTRYKGHFAAVECAHGLVHAMSTLADGHKAQQSLVSTGMFSCSVLPVCVAELLGDYFITLLGGRR